MEMTNPYQSAEPGRLDRVASDILRNVRLNKGFMIWMGFLSVGLLACLFAYTIQLRDGLGVTGLRDHTSWGMYIANFVFFVASSLIGMLISSVLGLIGFKWVIPIARIAEIIAVAFAAVAGLVIISDMGRPDRLPYVFLHGRIQSPILWDVTVVTTYFLVSFLLYFLPMLPDLAVAKGRIAHLPKWLQWLYNIASFNWIHKSEQYKILFRMTRTLLILIVPLAFAIHTVTSWLFAVTVRPGWDSTIFGPYFISGAFVSGSAAVIIAMFFFRHSFKLQSYLTPYHFDKMAKLLGLVAIVYFYFNLNEFLVPAYKLKKFEAVHLQELFAGSHALLFWGTQLLGLIIPIFLLFLKPMRKPLPLTIIALFVFAGSWLKRFIIVVPVQEHPFLPKQNVPMEWMVYTPTLIEVAVTVASMIMVLMIITILAKTFPVLPIVEIAAEGDGRRTTDDGGQKTTDDGGLTTDGRRQGTGVGHRSSVIGLLFFLMVPAFVQAQTWEVPADKKSKLADFKFDETSVKGGDAIYQVNCKSCHGDPGKNNVTKLVPLPPDIVSQQMQKNTDGELYYKLQKGKGQMPAFGVALTSQELWQVVAYIRSFNKEYEQEVASKGGTDTRYSDVQITLAAINDTILQATISGVENNIRVPIPVVEARVFAHRYFGHLPLDEPKSSDSAGTILFSIPSDLPADTAGSVKLMVMLTNEEQFGAIETDSTLNFGKATHPVSLRAKRAMWNTGNKAPIWLTIAYPLGLLIVLGVIGSILLQLREIFYIGKRKKDEN